MLTASQVEFFHENGYLVFPEFVSQGECQTLMDRTAILVDQWEPTSSRSVFTTEEQTRTSDEYFLASGMHTSFFYETEALDPVTGELTVAKDRAINKIGHAMHDLDPVYSTFARNPHLESVAKGLGIANALLLQSMYIFKQPGIGGEVVSHQDSTFLYTEPQSCIGFWFALQDATLDNGCLWAKPGGHHEPLRKVFKRLGDDADGTTFAVLDERPLPENDFVALPVKAGTMIALHGRLPHRSNANRSGISRHAYSLHVISKDAEYPTWNWLQRTTDLPLRGF